MHRIIYYLVLSIVVLAWNTSRAQDYPSRPISLIVPSPAGGIADVTTRILAEKMQATLGQPLIIENLPGGNGTIGTRRAVRAAADGYTILIGTTTSHAAVKSLVKNVPYDPLDDFEPISMIGFVSQMLIVNESIPVRNFQDLIKYGRANPGVLTFGAGSASARLAAATLGQRTGMEMVHVAYKSNVQAVSDLAGGHIKLMFVEIQAALPAVNAKNAKAKALTVAGAKRSPLAPDVPTTEEVGLKSFDLLPWFAAFAPAGVPVPIIEKLNRAFKQALDQPDVQEKLAGMGIETRHMSRQDFGAFVESEPEKWDAAFKAVGVVPQ